MWKALKVVLLVLFSFNVAIQAIDHMPCSENVDAAAMVVARRILEDSIPPGYRLTDFYPITRTGRNPHRWICNYERIDGVYREDCTYLTEVRGVFRRECPAGCEISQVVVSQSPNRRFVQVQFLVNCLCKKIPRRRRGLNSRHQNCTNMFNLSYKHEISTCSGFSHY